MAAIMMGKELTLRLKVSSKYQFVMVRWKKKPEWRDPTDISWAAPLLEKQKQQESSSDGVKQPPAMLHMVIRVRSVFGRPYWEKQTITALGLDKVKKYEPVVHKNIPQVNSMLAAVKHLIKIVPITFPHGLPSDESDFHQCILRENGRLEVKKTLHPSEKHVSTEQQVGDVWTMDKETVEKATKKVLDDFSLSREYFPAKYVYKYNQDGKEHRYFGNHNIGGDRDWY